MARKNKVSEAIYRHHIRLFRFLNDAWISTTLMRPLLKEKGDALIASKSKVRKEYPVPKKDRTVNSRRRDEDVGALFLAQHGRGIFDTNIISIISRVEAFIQDCIFEAVKQYPERLAIIGGKSGIPLDLYLKHEDLSCCRFDGHPDWVFHGAGGGLCRDEGSAENSRLRRSSLSGNAGYR